MYAKAMSRAKTGCDKNGTCDGFVRDWFHRAKPATPRMKFEERTAHTTKTGRRMIMLNPRKIQLMSRLAVLEKEQGKRLKRVRETYRSDYVGIPMLKNALRITAVFFFLLCIWAVNNIDFLLEIVAQLQLKLLMSGVLTAYIVVILVGTIITFLIASADYYKSRKVADEYEHLLKQLAALEEDEDEEYDRT